MFDHVLSKFTIALEFSCTPKAAAMPWPRCAEQHGISSYVRCCQAKHWSGPHLLVRSRFDPTANFSVSK